MDSLPSTVVPASAHSSSHASSGLLSAYHQRVCHAGWVHKHTSRLRTRLVKRYFRLDNQLLSNAHDESAEPTWTMSVSRSVVRGCEARRLIVVRLLDRELRFQLDTPRATLEWLAALRSASRCNLGDFYTLGAQLGFGSFGAVRYAQDVATGETRAVKIVERTRNEKEREFIMREIAVMLSVSHPNLVRTHDVFDEDDRICCVMDYVPGGDLFDYLAQYPNGLSEDEAREATRQVLKGVAYLHANDIVHRDIKPENILVKRTLPLHLQLTDFGFANFINSEDPATGMNSVVGTGCYMSPEVIDARGHGKPVDLFAVGVVMYKLVVGMLPFEGETLKECYKQVMEAPPTFDHPKWPVHAKALCQSLLEIDPEKRPTARAALKNPWFVTGSMQDRVPDRVVVRRVASMQNSRGGGPLVNALSAPLYLGAPVAPSFDDNGGGRAGPISSKYD